ncbi:MAG: hypothetical protein JO215_06435, partial [Ktedonobacteraceae bacterium]|nr:hypothetical protein [Ktedonobacteraceae bacterium]
MKRTLKSWWWVMSVVVSLFALISVTTAIEAKSFAPQAQTTLYISPTGNDANSGTQSQPVQTLQHAQALVRSMNQNMSGDINIFMGAGIYRLSQPLSLTSADSGTNGHNVIWSAAPGAHPVL